MRIATIYKIENAINKNCYIGSATNLSRRLKRHFKDLKDNKHHSIALQRAYNKYGGESFATTKVKVFLYYNKADILYNEQYFIDRNNSKYNMCKIAGSQLGSKRSDEFKKKCSDRMKGKTPWNKGIKLPKHSKELSKKRSIALKGHIVSDKTKELIKLKVSKPVSQFTKDMLFIKDWESAKNAATVLKMSYSSFTNYLNGKSNITTYKGFVWIRKDK